MTAIARLLQTALIVGAGAQLAGCAPTPRLEVAPSVLSTEWSNRPAVPTRPAAPFDDATPFDLGAAFGADELSQLLDAGVSRNADVAVTEARIRQARAQLGIARGAMLPAVSAAAGVSRTRTGTGGGPFDFSNAFSGGIDFSLDLDLFGAGRAERRAARARLGAAEFDRDAAILLLRTEIARAYVQRAVLARRIALLDRNIARAVDLERIIRLRVEAGEDTQVDLGLQTIQLQQLQTESHRLHEALDRTRTALAVLIGEEAPGFRLAPVSLDALTVPRLGGVVPPAVILDRPDIRAAEARIRAAGGDVDAARAAFFPRLQLSGRALGQAVSLGAPLTSTLAIGADLLAPIFNRGRLRGNLEVAAGAQAESVAVYRGVLLTGLADAENALSAVERSALRESILVRIVAEARRTAELARLQYREGEADLLRLFDAEQRLVEAEDAQAIAVQERMEAFLDLYNATGGGVSVSVGPTIIPG
jgi:multidrug efflux system outer membrane protein